MESCAMATTEKTTDTRMQVEDQIREIRSDVAKLTALLEKLAEERADTATRGARREAEDMLRRSVEMAERTGAKAREATESVETYIREKPVRAALIAFVIGLLFGSFSRR